MDFYETSLSDDMILVNLAVICMMKNKQEDGKFINDCFSATMNMLNNALFPASNKQLTA